MTGHNATSYSDIQQYGRCPASYRWRKVVNIQRKRKDPALRQGSAIHGGLETTFLALRDDASYEEAVDYGMGYFDDLIDNAWEDHPLWYQEEVDEYTDMLLASQDIVRRYLDQAEDTINTWEILHVEEEFLMFVGNEVVTFTPDLIIRDASDYVWIIDHKSTATIPTGGVPFSDLQTLTYYSGIKDMYPELRGFVFNYLRKAVPSTPRLNKTHNAASKAFGQYFVNNLKSIDTTYEILLDFLTESAPDLLGETSHQLRVAELRETNRFFFTETILVNDKTVEVMHQELEMALDNMQHSRDHDNYPRVFAKTGVQSCDRCEFQRICHTQLLGWNEELVLEEDYEPREPKNQYETETE